MDYTIRVKGTGSLNVKPDLIIITMDIVSHKYDYDDTMELATRSIIALEKAIEDVGFDKKYLKTTSFNVTTSYKGYYDKDNVYQKKFDGYICEQGLKLEFDLDMDLLAKTLDSITKSLVNPRLNIKFSVKDKDAINEELLIKATENARKKAEVLAKASKVALGKLINIDYHWDELSIYSPTSYEVESKSVLMDTSYSPNIEPDDISVSDTVAFIWQIK